MPPAKFKTKRKQDHKAEALVRLRAHWEAENEGDFEPAGEPTITPMLKSVPGGVRAVMEAMRAHGEEDARTFIQFYDSLTKIDRASLSLESIAYACGIGALRLAEVAQTALFLYGQMKTKMLLSSAMPKVMRSTIKAATDEVPITALVPGAGNIVVGHTNGDVKAMEMFHKMSGMMPLPKGAQIAIQNNFGETEAEKPASAGWRPPEERLREFQEMTEPKRLPSPPAEPFPLGSHVDQMQAETVEMLRE